jgi:small-conductance mechanosensitive channel
MEYFVDWILVVALVVLGFSILFNLMYDDGGKSGKVVYYLHRVHINRYKRRYVRYTPHHILATVLVETSLVLIISTLLGYFGSGEYFWTWILYGAIQAAWYLLRNWMYMGRAQEELILARG